MVVNDMFLDIGVTDITIRRAANLQTLSLDIHLFTKSILSSDKYSDERCAPEKLK